MLLEYNYFEPKQRALTSLLAAGVASKLKTDYIPYGRRFPVACCGELQYNYSGVSSQNSEEYEYPYYPDLF